MERWVEGRRSTWRVVGDDIPKLATIKNAHNALMMPCPDTTQQQARLSSWCGKGPIKGG